MDSTFLIVNIPDPSTNTYSVGDVVVATEWIDSKGCDFELPPDTVCRVEGISDAGSVCLSPVEVDIGTLYDDIDEYEFDYDEDMWDEAYYRRDCIEECQYKATVDQIELEYSKPPLPPTKERKKSRLHNLGILLRKKTRDLMARVSGFFKRKKDLPGVTGETFTIKLDQGWTSSYNMILGEKGHITINKAMDEYIEYNYPTTTTQWVDTGITL